MGPSLRRLVALAIAAVVATSTLVSSSAPSGAATGSDPFLDFFFSDEDVPLLGEGTPIVVRLEEQDVPAGVTGLPIRVSSSSDPVGMVLLAERLPMWGMYIATFHVTRGSTNLLTSTLHAADGDTLTAEYLDGATSSGVPQAFRATITWSAVSRYPDRREVVLENVDPAAPAVSGSEWAVGAGAAVRVYSSASAGTPIGEGTADDHGRFRVVLPSSIGSGSTVWVSATEPGAAESARTNIPWASLVGRVRTPDGAPARITIAAVLDAQGASVSGGGGLSDSDGRWAKTTPVATGSYQLALTPQGGATYRSSFDGAEWDNQQSYGAPPARSFSVTATDRTLDLGTSTLLAPTFRARVVDALGLAVPGAVASTTTTGGEFVAAGAQSRSSDGRLALYLPDGQYRVRVDPPTMCNVGLTSRTVEVSVSNGVASPNDIDVDIGLGEPSETGIVLPVHGDGTDLPFRFYGPDGDFTLLLEDLVGSGEIQVGCRTLADRTDESLVNTGAFLGLTGASFSSAEVCVGYSDDAVAAKGVAESDVRVLALDGAGALQALTTDLDTAANRACSTVDSLSTLAAGTATGAAAVLPRLAGVDRVATAVAISRDSFPTASSADGVVLATSGSFADAIAGTPLAVEMNGPLLLTAADQLSSATADEIGRVLPAGGTVALLGGDAALAASVESAIEAMGYRTVRYAGLTRAGTAVDIAERGLPDASTVMLVNGLDFPDALAAGAAAASVDAVILMTAGSQPAPETTAYLAAHPDRLRFAIGGPAAVADPSATRVVGVDRYDTAVRVAERFLPSTSGVGLASGRAFPDALAGGAHSGALGQPVILVPPTGTLPATVSAYLGNADVTTAVVYGGSGAVSTAVASAASSAIERD